MHRQELEHHVDSCSSPTMGDPVHDPMVPALTKPDASRRLAAVVAVVTVVGAALALLVGMVQSFPDGPVLAALVVLAAAAVLDGLRRRGTARSAEVAMAALLLVIAGALALRWRAGGPALIAVALIAVGGMAARRAFAASAVLPEAPRPLRPVVIWNPRSGGGKAAKANLDAEAGARGIRAIELRPGDDLVELVEGAVADGADALAAAGGDGTQALVVSIAAREGLPFACIPAGTRNHFALDLGVDRNDVIGALDALVDGGERVVDLAEVNGRVFVNNASLGVYVAAVQRDAYRNAKVSTLLDTVPDAFGRGEEGAGDLRWSGPDGSAGQPVVALLVSNNPYRLGTIVGSGTRPRLDAATLGVAAVGTHFQRWTTPEFVVDSDAPVPIGVDGEALLMDPPLVFRVRPAALKVRIARSHRGASPSSDAPAHTRGAMAALLRIAAGRSGSSG